MTEFIEGINGIVERAFAGPYSLEFSFVGMECSRSVIIDMYETGRKIKRECLERGYTVRKLHEELNVRVQSVYAWLAGSAMPSLENMYQLSSLFEIPMEQMIAEPPKLAGIYVQVNQADENRTARTMWKYYARELRSCMYENVRPQGSRTIIHIQVPQT